MPFSFKREQIGLGGHLLIGRREDPNNPLGLLVIKARPNHSVCFASNVSTSTVIPTV